MADFLTAILYASGTIAPTDPSKGRHSLGVRQATTRIRRQRARWRAIAAVTNALKSACVSWPSTIMLPPDFLSPVASPFPSCSSGPRLSGSRQASRRFVKDARSLPMSNAGSSRAANPCRGPAPALKGVFSLKRLLPLAAVAALLLALPGLFPAQAQATSS